jgi:hypothetical protein
MGSRPSEKQFARRLPAALAAVLDISENDVSAEYNASSGADLFLSAASQTFAVELLGSGTPGSISTHAGHIAQAAKKSRRTIPLLVVPFMTEAGRRAAIAAGASWLDLSGNAHIVGPGLRVIVDGRPNQFKRRGRPTSIFAPKSARVVRWLLTHPDRSFTQREIARATSMTEGFVSRIVARLEADAYVSRIRVIGDRESTAAKGSGRGSDAAGDDGGASSHYQRKSPMRVRDPALLLDAWREEYEFDKHTIIRGHIAARSGDALARFVGDRLTAKKVEHAATGLAAAWQLTHFAAFRIATFFVTSEIPPDLGRKLGFREDPSGANMWFVVPNDAGVFQGAQDRDGLRCVHPVQAYLDLEGHPERAAEAAERLRAEFMNWKRDA